MYDIRIFCRFHVTHTLTSQQYDCIVPCAPLVDIHECENVEVDKLQTGKKIKTARHEETCIILHYMSSLAGSSDRAV
jgi:hypothetical protein